MDCPNCNKHVRCIDSRKKLSYVNDIRKGEKEPIRERRYVCIKCNMIYITREFIYQEYPGRIKDKRVLKKKQRKPQE